MRASVQDDVRSEEKNDEAARGKKGGNSSEIGKQRLAQWKGVVYMHHATGVGEM
jgi:hypothetical protein